MKPQERIDLIGEIACHLQAEYVTREINNLLTAYGVDGASADSVSSKRVYVQVLLKDVPDRVVLQIARDYGLAAPSGAVSSQQLESYLSSRGLSACESDFSRALEHVDSDPDQALGSACSFLESVCKAILDDLGIPYPKKESVSPLVTETCRALNLSPDQHADAEIKRILGGLSNVASGIGVIRTKFSAAHGRGSKQGRLWARHARLSISAAAAVALFLLETNKEHHKS